MRKVGIFTLYGYVNYGNRLQNYAVQRIFEKYGYQCITFVVRNSVKPILKTLLMFVKACMGSVDAQRYIGMLKFTKKYIHTKLIYVKDMKVKKTIDKDYDLFSVGSDQVWNPYIRHRERDNFFLRFTSKDKRICVSPSFGVEDIPKEYQDDYQNGLLGFKYLCCRENAGAEIIYRLTGKKAEVLIDPTLALDVNDWKKIFIVPKIYKPNKYLISAFLGERSIERQNIIQTIAKSENLEVIDIFQDFAYEPGEMLYLLYNSSLVCTDSFHFSAFSINFNKAFIVFERLGQGVEERMFSRLETLLDKFGLNECIYTNKMSNYICCDFSKANLVLSEERKKFFGYMDVILD